MRKPISVTIHEDNLLWLRAQAAATAHDNVSAVLDRLVTEARTEGRSAAGAIRSVAGSIDLPADDPDLEQADAYVRGVMDSSLRRPMLVKEDAPSTGRGKAKRRG